MPQRSRVPAPPRASPLPSPAWDFVASPGCSPLHQLPREPPVGTACRGAVCHPEEISPTGPHASGWRLWAQFFSPLYLTPCSVWRQNWKWICLHCRYFSLASTDPPLPPASACGGWALRRPTSSTTTKPTSSSTPVPGAPPAAPEHPLPPFPRLFLQPHCPFPPAAATQRCPSGFRALQRQLFHSNRCLSDVCTVQCLPEHCHFPRKFWNQWATGKLSNCHPFCPEDASGCCLLGSTENAAQAPQSREMTRCGGGGKWWKRKRRETALEEMFCLPVQEHCASSSLSYLCT